jgi:hypothetical protein
MVIVFDVTGLPVAQVALDVSTQLTASPLFGEYEKVALFDPTFVPLTFH